MSSVETPGDVGRLKQISGDRCACTKLEGETASQLDSLQYGVQPMDDLCYSSTVCRRGHARRYVKPDPGYSMRRRRLLKRVIPPATGLAASHLLTGGP